MLRGALEVATRVRERRERAVPVSSPRALPSWGWSSPPAVRRGQAGHSTHRPVTQKRNVPFAMAKPRRRLRETARCVRPGVRPVFPGGCAGTTSCYYIHVTKAVYNGSRSPLQPSPPCGASRVFPGKSSAGFRNPC